QVRIWDAATGRKVRRLGKRAELSPADAQLDALRRHATVSADGRRAATCDDRGVRVWDVATGKELRRFKGEHLDHLFALALTPDGQGLLTSTHEAQVVLWDVATGKERCHFEIKTPKDDPPLNVGAAVFSPDRKFLAAPYFEGITEGKTVHTG